MDTGSAHLILIVEDEPLVSMAVEDTVSEAGFQFIAVGTGDAA